MSIRFLPYTSKYKHDGMKIYHPMPSVGCLAIIYRTSNHATQLEQIIVPINDDEWKQLQQIIIDPRDEYLNERKRIFILEDFANIIQKMTNHFTASIWKTVKACPLLTIRELLWLKVDDVDSRVDHVEKMLIQLMKDKSQEASAKNTKLEQYLFIFEANVVLRKDLEEASAKNTKLEQEIILLRKEFDDAKQTSLTFMNCLQSRINALESIPVAIPVAVIKTVGEELLYDS
jgi:hypothetical protein